MAKKFVKVNGLHNVFEASANIASSTIKSGASASVDANSILFITADADDVDLFGDDYPSMKEGAHYIWAQGVLHDTNSGLLNVTLDGGDYINTEGSYLSPGKAHFVVNHDESGVTAGTFGMAGASSVGAGGSIVVKVPKFTVDEYGHLTAASEANLTIGVPAAETHKKTDHKPLTIKCGSSSYTYTSLAAQTIDVDAAIDKKMTTAVVYRGKATVDLADGATTAASSLGITGYTTAKSGDLIISKDGVKEFMWNGSIWEEVGAENKSIVTYSDTAKSGTTYEIGKITINGTTTTLIGRDNNTVTTVSYTDSSKTGTTYEIGKITINGTTTTLIGRDNNTTYSASNGVKLSETSIQADIHSTTKLGVTGTTGSTSQVYRVGLDAAGKLAVGVPWANTAHKHTAGTGLTCDNTTGSTSGTVKYSLNAATSSAIGGIAIGYPENGKNYPVELDANNKAYVNVPWANTTYGASGGVELVDSSYRAALHTWEKMGATGVASTSSSRYYRVGLDAAGKLAVNVPWTDTNTNTAHGHAAGDGIILSGGSSLGGTITIGVTAATTTKYGGIKTNYTASGKNYPVKLDTSGNAYVNVPWENNTYTVNNGTLTLKIAGTVGATHSANTSANTTFDVPEASASAHGVIKVSSKNTSAVTVNAESTTAGRYYPIELNSDGKAIVNVPWKDTDNNTTYTLSGAVVGTTGSAAANTSVTTAVASAVSFKDTLTPSSGNASTSTCILMNGDGVINLKTISGKTNAIEIDYTGVATAEDWATIG